MTPIDAMDNLANTPDDANAADRVRALGECFQHLQASNDAHLLSIYAGDASLWGSPELEGLPNARRWVPNSDEQGYPSLFFDSDLSLAQRTGGAIERAAAYSDIPSDILNRNLEPNEGIAGKTLIESLIAILNNEWSGTRLCEALWKDRQIGPVAKAIYGLSFEADNYLIFIAPGDLGEPSVVFVGEQPFEAMLYAAGTPKGEEDAEVIPETTQINGHTLEAKTILPRAWWDELASEGMHTLLRATLMQMATPGQALDIITPDNPPSWRNVPMLGL